MAVQPTERAEEVAAQIVLDVERELPPVVPADLGAAEDDRCGDQQHDRPRPQRAGVRGDHVVDDQLGDQRDECRDGHTDERGTEREQHTAAVPPAVTDQPAEPALLCGG